MPSFQQITDWQESGGGPQVLQGQAAMDGPEGGLFTVECKRSV